jgi:uncharacterized membrane protein HdeD (DUF308 family)
MSSERDPISKRLFNLAIGALYVILALYVAIDPDVAVSILINVLGVVLIISGMLRIFNSFFEEEIGGFHRMARLFLGLGGFFIGIAIIVVPEMGEELLVELISIGLLLQGLTRVINGLTRNLLPLWLQLILIILGLLTIGLSVYVLINIDLTTLTLVLYLSYGFLLNGFGRMLMAITGYSTKKQE